MGLTHPTVGIVGGTGRMGSWFANLFERGGLRVLRAGRKTRLTPSSMVRKSDVVVISVPIAETVEVIRELGPLVRENGLLMDLTSIKKGPLEAMLQYSRAEVVGTHPLFGPEEEDRAERKVAICPGRGERGLRWLTGILGKAGIRVVVMDPEEHDRIMGLIQGVSHFSTLALALCISRSGFSFDDVLRCATWNFKSGLDRIRAMAGQPSELFESLLMANPGAGEFIERYGDAVEKMMGITRQKDTGAFRGVFNSLKAFFRANQESEVVSS
jgi:prephenate dehydrogenase